MGVGVVALVFGDVGELTYIPHEDCSTWYGSVNLFQVYI